MRLMKDRLTGPLTIRVSDRYSIRSQRPDTECRDVIDDFESRSPMEQWLLNWSPDSGVYTNGSITIRREATAWLVRFRDAETGKDREVRVPMAGTPPPPGWKG